MGSSNRYQLIVIGLALALSACATPVNNAPTTTDGNTLGSQGDGGVTTGDGSSVGSADGGTGLGVPMTCPGPGTPRPNTSSCGSERWNIKTGTDSAASTLSLVPRAN